MRMATPKNGFLKGSRTMLECYNDSKFTNHSKITLQLQHYTNKSFQDHQFYVVEMQTWKEIIIGHPASVRLGLIQVFCKNIAKTIHTIESNNLNNVKNIDGDRSNRRSKSEPVRCLNWISSNRISSNQIKCSDSSKPGMYTCLKWLTVTETTEMSDCNISKGSFQDLLSRPWRIWVKKLNSQYMTPTNENTKVISDPEKAKRMQLQNQVNSGPTQSF